MSEAEFREIAWSSCTRRIIEMIEIYCQCWMPNSPSKATAEAIIKKIRAMPVPQPGGER